MMRTIQFLAILFMIAVWTNMATAETSEVVRKYVDACKKMESKDLNERKTGQQDWQNFCRSLTLADPRRPEAVEIMVNHVEASLKPGSNNSVDTTVWMIRQLGIIGTPWVVPTLAECLKSDEIRIRDEAARALANIPGEKSLEALKGIDSRLAKDALKEHDPDRDILKKAGNETLMPLAIPYASEQAVADWMKGYDKFDDLKKAQTLANLTVRRDGKYVQQALDALKSDDDFLRDTAILGVGAMGDARQVPELLAQLFDGKNKDLAKIALSRMTDRNLDVQLTEQLEQEKNADRFEAIADVLRQRDYASVMPIVLKRANSTDCPNRLALLRIAEPFASKQNIGDFVDVWEKISDRSQKDQAEQVIARLVDGDAGPVVNKRTDSNYAAMFSLLGRIGDEKSLEEIRNRVFEKTLPPDMKASPELKAAALRAMCNWPDGRVADDLFEIAENDRFSDADRITALRAFARVVSLPNEQIKINIDDKEKVKRLAKGMDVARRTDEKRLIVQRAGQVRHGDSLRFIMKYFDDKDLQHQVCWSITDLAHHTWLRDSAKDDFKSALDKVLSVSKDQNQLDRARRYRDAMN